MATKLRGWSGFVRARARLLVAATNVLLAACHPRSGSDRGVASEASGPGASASRAALSPAPVAGAAPAHEAPTIRVAVTFDDLPAHGPLQPHQTRADVHRQILDTLAAHRVPSVYGFINGSTSERSSDGRQVLEQWRDAGHPLGNHTWAHEDVGEVGAAAFIQGIDRNDALLAELMGDDERARRSRRVFRYPYLRQGRDRATLDEVRLHLERNGYRLAEVTIDFGDWAYNAPFVRCTAAAASKAIQVLRWNYVRRGVEYLQWSEAASRTIYGRSIPHVLLLHTGTFDAVVLDELLGAYEEEGVRWVPLDEVLADAAYQEDVRVPSPFGGTLLEQRIERDQPATPPYHIQSESLLEHVCRDAPPEAATPSR
jgi:peptidoglycan-N-acetylglucosamine deacetylase